MLSHRMLGHAGSFQSRMNALLRNVAPALPPRAYAELRLAWWHTLASAADRKTWERRIELVLACPDTHSVPRVDKAGHVIGGHQVMHNGLRVLAGGYYGYPILDMLQRSRGVHEPQEERAFAEVLPHIPAASSMLELGSYWAFYSMWFAHTVRDARSLMVEPDRAGSSVGQYNMKHNGLRSTLVRAFIGSEESARAGKVGVQTVDGILERNGVSKLAVLHSDIQGAELDMLHGAKRLLDRGGVDWVFISTHANELHYACEDFLKKKGHSVVSSIDLDDSFSEDGLLITKRPGVSGPERIDLSRRNGREPSEFQKRGSVSQLG